ncbi:peptidyl prolyl isomerase G [Echinococcus multilocularis]|uniref:Peptidyl prolyl isomerase G n=1 Tax=Echinococcus multilocularis TaxID=6211 RepID=A0A068XUS1_ECHMU|nr:peptidyl prolyl isomerase G [Echinococcus multilocularis]
MVALSLTIFVVDGQSRTTAPAPHLNGKHMVFGHVLSGREVVAKIEAVPVSDTRIYKPIKPVVISNCGELVPIKKKKSDDQKKESKKKKKKAKKSKKKKSRRRRSSSFGSDSDSVKIRPEEIPDIPKNKFLYRPSPSNSNKASYVENQNYSLKFKSGRKVKGRGQVRYRTPDSRSGSRDRGLTPEHWHQAARRSRRRSPEDESRSRTKQFREQIASSREENVMRDVRTRSPLNTTGRGPDKNHSDCASVMNRQSPYHEGNAKTMSPVNTSSGRRDRSRDKAQKRYSRRVAAEISDERWVKEPEATPPPVRRQRVDDPSPEEEDLRHGYHQRRTPSPPPPPPTSHSALSRGQNRSRVEGGGRNVSNSRRSSKSGRSPSPSSHRVSDRKHKISRSPSRSRSPSFTQSRKRSNEREIRRDSPPISSKLASTRKRETSQNRLGSVERRKLSPTRGDYHGSPHSPPAHLINKWEERRKQVLRKRDSLLKVSRRRDISPGSPPTSPRLRHSSSSSRSRSSPRHLNPVLSTHHSSPRSSKKRTHSPSSRSPSPIKSKADPIVASKETSDSTLYDAALPTGSTSPLNIPLPPEPSSVAAISSEREHPPSSNAVANKEESQKRGEGEEKKDNASTTASPTTIGPWTTSRWQADDELEKDATAPGLNTSAKISPVKLAIGGSLETASADPTSVDMDVSDIELEPKNPKKLPINDLKDGNKASISEAPMESKPTAPAVKSSKSAPKPKSRSISSSASSTSSSSSGSSSSDASSFRSRSRSRSFCRRRSGRRRGRSRSTVADMVTSVLAPAAVVITVVVAPAVVKAHGVEGRDPIRIDHVVGDTALRIHVDVGVRTPRIPVHRAVHTHLYLVVDEQWPHHRELAYGRSCG